MDDHEPQEIQVEVPPELEVGVYANFAAVTAGEHDFILDFCQVQPRRAEDETQAVRVVSRIRIAPSFVGPLLQAISSNAFSRDEALRQAREQNEEGGESE